MQSMIIGSSNDAEAVKAQYSTSSGLNTRIAFHDKYSTNKTGYGNWDAELPACGQGMII